MINNIHPAMKKILISLLMLVSASSAVSAQPASTAHFYEAYQVDSLPRIYLHDRIVTTEEWIDQHIPWQAGMHDGEKVAVSFVVDTNGYVVALELLEIPKHCDLCLREYVRALTSLPQLKPAYQGGVPVHVKLKQVFYFKIKR